MGTEANSEYPICLLSYSLYLLPLFLYWLLRVVIDIFRLFQGFSHLAMTIFEAGRVLAQVAHRLGWD